MKKVFIDGSAGTTGLRIFDRLHGRTDIQLLTLPESERKLESSRKRLLNEADVVFLCLPDDAAREFVTAITEAREKLDAVQPISLGQASRVPGVSPADISALLVWLEKQKRSPKEDTDASN